MASVLIIGAGASGLTAGYDLKRFGVSNVTILEATDHHGGRVKKLAGFADFPIDLGAEWIELVGPRILGEIVDNPNVNIEVDTVLQVVSPSVYKGNKFSHKARQFGEDYMFVNYTWYDFFTDYIFPTVEKDVEYNCPVSHIDYSNRKVKVTSACGNFTADKVVITAPLNVLKSGAIKFRPALPKKKTRALAKANMPSGMKVFMKFKKSFYPKMFVDKADLKSYGYMFWDETYGETTTDHVLGLFCYDDDRCNELIKLPDHMVVTRLLGELDGKFGGRASANFIKAHVQNWHNEPYTKGAYSWYGDSYHLVDTLRTPLNGKVFFAGEHIPSPKTNYEYGFAWAAALSGRDAAKSILTRFGIKEGPNDDDAWWHSSNAPKDDDDGAW